MSDITQQQLSDLLTTPDREAQAALWIAPLNAAMRGADISTRRRQALFLAQVLIESGELRHLEENLRYKAQALHRVWPQHFADEQAAAPYQQAPEKLANKVYANRLGNGDEASGDGWAYRGRGLLQITGRNNYADFARDMQVDAINDPDLLAQPAGAALQAAWFWQKRGFNDMADMIAGPDDYEGFKRVCIRLSGGTAGLTERWNGWLHARDVLGDDA